MSKENNLILEKLEGVKDRYEEVQKLIAEPEIITDMKRYIQLNKEYKNLEPIIDAYKKYKNVLSNIKSSREMLEKEKDIEMREMAKLDIEELNEKLPEMEENIKLLLIPKDPEDDKNAVVEIRAGTGGDEASIFAGDLYRMYTKFCETKNGKLRLEGFQKVLPAGLRKLSFLFQEKGFTES